MMAVTPEIEDTQRVAIVEAIAAVSVVLDVVEIAGPIVLACIAAVHEEATIVVL